MSGAYVARKNDVQVYNRLVWTWLSDEVKAGVAFWISPDATQLELMIGLNEEVRVASDPFGSPKWV